MRRIGTTSEGGALIEITAEEVKTIQTALDLLGQINADGQESITQAPARIILEPATRAPRKARIAKATGTRVCSKCGVEKPLSDYYEKTGRCKPCYNEVQRAMKAAREKSGGTSIAAKKRAEGLSVIKKVRAARAAGKTFLPRERDPALDAPLGPGGRVMPVGGGE